MYQPPNDPNSFYNDQTQAYPQYQPPYQPQAPYQQHSYQQSPNQQPYQQPSYPPQPGSFAPPPPQKPGLWRRYRSARKSVQWGIGCGAVILALLVCSVCASASAATNTATPKALASVTPTQNTLVVNSASTPTAAPTEQTIPTATPTQQPTPTLVPTQPPTPTPEPPTPVSTQAPKPTQPPAPTTPATRTGINGNPWGYDFDSSGSVIYTPAPGFCSGQYFSCIPSFANGTGYVVQCADGLYSKSGGHKGSCSHHGGDKAILYSH